MFSFLFPWMLVLADGVHARPVELDGLAEARAVDARGEWVAFVRELPLPEELRRMHAPRPPWQLVRHGPDGAQCVAEEGAGRVGPWPPNRVAVGADGTVAALWDRGMEVFFAPPGGAATRLVVRGDEDLECVGLSTAHVVLRDRKSGALRSRALAPGRPGEPVALGACHPRPVDGVAFGDPWLAWIDEEGGLYAVDVATGARSRLEARIGARATLDGVWDGRLYAHAGWSTDTEVLLADLAAGAAWRAPFPGAVLACTPEGVLCTDRLWDPVDGAVQRVALASTHVDVALRVAPGRLWLLARGALPQALDLTGAEPDGAALAAPECALPPAARAAWR